MATLTLTRGCSGSGKTTWAEEQVKKYNNIVNINRDNLREMLFIDYKFSKQKEELVTKVQRDSATQARELNYDIIISDTNISQKTVDYWKLFSKENGLDFHIKEFIVDFEVLKKRNEKRGKESVPISVLKKQYKTLSSKPYHFNQEAPKAILFDIDGTLANHNGRSAYDLDNLGSDLVIDSTLELLNFYKNNYSIIIFSGREQGANKEYQIATEMWLDRNNIHYDLLKMRLHKDNRPDYIIKDQMIRSIKGYNIILAVDDRQQVVDQYRMNGLTCIQVADGDF